MVKWLLLIKLTTQVMLSNQVYLFINYPEVVYRGVD
jgi:hypothetical protein